MKTKQAIGSILAADDLRVGAYVTIHSVAVGHRLRAEPGEPPQVIEEYQATPPAPPGTPLQIRAVSLPYVTCATLQPGGEFTGPVTIDIRNLRLMKVTRRYVAAIRRFPVPKGGAAGSSASDSGGQSFARIDLRT